MLNHLKSRADWNEKTLGEKGFTLIELLVVIIILGILAAVAIFAMGNIQDNAQESACKTERNTVKTAIAAWVSEEPGTRTAGAVAAAGGVQELIDEGYLDADDATLEYVTSISSTGVPVADCD